MVKKILAELADRAAAEIGVAMLLIDIVIVMMDIRTLEILVCIIVVGMNGKFSHDYSLNVRNLQFHVHTNCIPKAKGKSCMNSKENFDCNPEM